MTVFFHWLLTIFTICLYLPAPLVGQLQLVSTESDPDAFIQNSVNVINGDYCESATDLVIRGPDVLVIQRFYITKDSITATKNGGWRIFPERFLVIGKDLNSKSSNTLALTGERSVGILPYTGFRNTNGITQDPLKIDVLNNALGMVNTYSKDINGQNNHANNRLHCKGNLCELILGDGTKRIYKRVEELPSTLFGEELTPIMAAQVIEHEDKKSEKDLESRITNIIYDPLGHISKKKFFLT